jgi:hypothetical protein
MHSPQASILLDGGSLETLIVRIGALRVIVVQQRTGCGSREDPAAKGLEAIPEGASVVSERPKQPRLY